MANLVSPTQVRLVLTREAAKVLGCSMARVRALAIGGSFKSWNLGPKSFAYDLDELKRFKAERDIARKLGKVRGPKPQGFSAYVTPGKRKKKVS